MNTGETCKRCLTSHSLHAVRGDAKETQATPAAPRARPEGEQTHGNWTDQDRSDAASGREAGTDQQASAAFLDLLAETAIKETKKNGVFVIPGIGRLVKAERKARIGRNPQTGAAIKIKAKTVVKFRVAKAAKDVIAPPKK